MRAHTLNIGCGTDPYGDIRIDIVSQRPLHERKNTVNLIADAQNLPLRDKIFFKTRCFHVLEHLENPKKAFSEMIRVTKGKINVRVPVWHPYSYLIEAIAFIAVFFIGRPYAKIKMLKQILNLKIRYSDHKYYIKLKNAKINKKFSIPTEYETTYNIDQRTYESDK